MPGTPANTPRFAIPRYANTDVVDFAGQVNAVSDRVDVVAGRFESGLLAARPSTGAGIADRYYWATDTKELYRDAGGATPTWENVTRRDVPIVTALPASADRFDGQEIDYLADAAASVVWRLRWRASVARWEFVGGGRIFARATGGGNQGTAGVSTVADLVNGPSLIIPRTGVFEAYIQGQVGGASATLDARAWLRPAGGAVSTCGGGVTIAAAQYAYLHAQSDEVAVGTAGLAWVIGIATNNVVAAWSTSFAWTIGVRPRYITG